jgi:hypothetical protein
MVGEPSPGSITLEAFNKLGRGDHPLSQHLTNLNMMSYIYDLEEYEGFENRKHTRCRKYS